MTRRSYGGGGRRARLRHRGRGRPDLPPLHQQRPRLDGEIELKDDQGRATGQRLYLQLKSGDSYLSHRERDNAEVFQIKNPRWSSYWQQQAYPVMLVIRTADGVIRWMDVSDYLRREFREGKPLTQIVFLPEANCRVPE